MEGVIIPNGNTMKPQKKFSRKQLLVPAPPVVDVQYQQAPVEAKIVAAVSTTPEVKELKPRCSEKEIVAAYDEAPPPAYEEVPVGDGVAVVVGTPRVVNPATAFKPSPSPTPELQYFNPSPPPMPELQYVTTPAVLPQQVEPNNVGTVEALVVADIEVFGETVG
ncbi:hypothetical protein AAMO2058_000568300 [Amorphochlora amoebiformis]